MVDLNKYPAEIAGAINAVMADVDYVQKRGENKFYGYKFAAVGDLLAKLQPAMAKHGLIVIQNEMGHTLSPSGGVMEVKYEFTIIHKGGSVWPDRPVHTGMAAATNSKGGFDDKCVNKCMTAARKYFLLALFQIPTGEDADPDADAGPMPERPNGTKTAKPQVSEADGWKTRAEAIKTSINEAETPDDIDKIIASYGVSLKEIKDKSQTAYDFLMKGAETRKSALMAAAA